MSDFDREKYESDRLVDDYKDGYVDEAGEYVEPYIDEPDDY